MIGSLRPPTTGKPPLSKILMSDQPPSEDNSPDNSPMLRPHGLKIVLVHPQIAPNTGNIARLCVATGTELHLVRPLGFVLSDKNIKRSAMDYWPRLKLTVHDDAAAAMCSINGGHGWILSSRAKQSVWQATFSTQDWLILGSESHGLGEIWHKRFHNTQLRIPQTPGERCLNVSTAAGVALFEALRQIDSSAG